MTKSGRPLVKARFPDVQTTARRRRGSRRLTLGMTSPATIGRKTGSALESIGLSIPMKSRILPIDTSFQRSLRTLVVFGVTSRLPNLRKTTRSPRRQSAGTLVTPAAASAFDSKNGMS
jgi:hypothetical protein